MNLVRSSLVVCALLTTAPAVLRAQSEDRPDSLQAKCQPERMRLAAGLATVGEEYERLLEISGRAPPRMRLVLRSAVLEPPVVCAGAAHPWRDEIRLDTSGAPVELAPARLLATYNSDYPYERNNASLWAGRGLGALVDAGATYRHDYFRVQLRPAIAFQQNANFRVPLSEVVGFSQFAYRWSGGSIDWPSRFGDESYWDLDPGQTYLRFEGFGVAAGVSTENLWWGPANRFPLLMSNTAPGFEHVYLGTAQPANIWIGDLGVELIWGRLHESEFYDTNPDNDTRFLGGIVLGFRPRPLPGLTLGVARAFSTYTDHDFADYLTGPVRGMSSNLVLENELASLFGRWVLPESGFEAYAEWARDDNWQDLADFLKEPDHSQGYMLGVQKVTPMRDGKWLRVLGELVHLQSSQTGRSGRGFVTFYTHGGVRQGHTNRGQLLGASVGPGSDAQYIAVDLITPAGSYGLFLERARYDDDAYFAHWGTLYDFRGHDVELTGGLRFTRFFSGVLTDMMLGFSGRYNRNFLDFGAPRINFPYYRNVQARVEASWVPGKAWKLPVKAR